VSKKQKPLEKRTNKKTPRRRPDERWRPPSVEDLSEMLKAADIAAEPSVIKSFRTGITRALSLGNEIAGSRGPPPSDQHKNLDAVVTNAKKLANSLKKINATALSIARDAQIGRTTCARTLDELRSAMPNAEPWELIALEGGLSQAGPLSPMFSAICAPSIRWQRWLNWQRGMFPNSKSVRKTLAVWLWHSWRTNLSSG